MMRMVSRIRKVILEALPIALMLAIVYVIQDELIISALFVFIIAVAFLVRYEKLDATALVLGVVIMTLSEIAFVGTGIETFRDTTLFGVMPVWLPLLWGYAFVAIKRSAFILR